MRQKSLFQEREIVFRLLLLVGNDFFYIFLLREVFQLSSVKKFCLPYSSPSILIRLAHPDIEIQFGNQSEDPWSSIDDLHVENARAIVDSLENQIGQIDHCLIYLFCTSLPVCKGHQTPAVEPNHSWFQPQESEG